MSEPKFMHSEAGNWQPGVWHEWRGGTCPVSPDTMVKVYLRDDLTLKAWALASQFVWDWEGAFDDVIGFMVMPESEVGNG